MAKKYYAVKEGIAPGIYTTWAECQQNIKGYSNAVYKSFGTLAEAQAFIEQGKGQPPRTKPVEAVAYVDGSYQAATKEYACGVVIFHEGKEEHFSQRFTDSQSALMRNVAGEIEGAKYAMAYCLQHQIKSLDIYYDYAGIEKWCNGEWKANKDGTKAYQSFFEEASKKVDIRFIKVKGHSGDTYNEVADQLAKAALGI